MLTIHSVVRNEPFIYYSIKSVYPFAEKILLYDTGSTDAHTLEDIQLLLAEDTAKKIIFKQIPIETNEVAWTLDNLAQMIKDNQGKKGVGWVRQMQIDDTDTEFFMIADGDEVHHISTMLAIRNTLLALPPKVNTISVPLTWFYNMTSTFPEYRSSCRVFRTNNTMMDGNSPNENHIIKGTRENMGIGYDNTMALEGVTPYAHFETVLKPWRRKSKISLDTVTPFTGRYPEVMLDNYYFVERFLTK